MKSLYFQIKSYVRYLLESKTAHDLHSPFVYNLLINVILNKSTFYIYRPMELLRQELLRNNKIIEIQDFGAGSKYKGRTKRRISDITRQSVKSDKYAKLLFRLSENHQAKSILELGTSLGLSTMYLSYACPKAQIITIEGSPEIAAIAQSYFDKVNRKNIKLHVGKFDDILPKIVNKQKVFDFVFIDGNHSEEATLKYFNLLIKHSNQNSLFIFDDIHWSPGMENAWKKIKANENVSLSIDLFEMGLIYFMPRNQKEHFVIRF